MQMQYNLIKKITLALIVLSFSCKGYIPLDSKIYVAGHNGLVGSAILQALQNKGYSNIIVRSSQELDLRDAQAVNTFFAQEKPDYVFLAAAKVGGIKSNITYPANFIYDNLAIQTNVIHAAYVHGVTKLLFLGSSCIYPRLCPQPMKEEYLMTGPVEPTNEAYAIAKIAGVKMCQAYYRQYGCNFISCMPTNLYGPRDNFDLESAHAIPALIVRMHNAKINGEKEVVVWGSGNARREWLFVEDLAHACILLMEEYNKQDNINIGTGKDISMRDLAYLIKDIVGYEGDLIFDTSKPEGMPQKLLNIDKATEFGWHPHTELAQGIQKTYEWYLKNHTLEKSL